MGATMRRMVLALYAIIIAVPLVVVIFGSLKNTSEIFSSPFGLPTHWRVGNFVTAVDAGSLGDAFVNSAVVTLASVIIVLVLATLTAFAVSRMPGWRGWLIFGVIVAGMSIPPQSNMIQQYVLLGNIGLLDSLWGLILINVVATLPISVFIIGGFMKTIPHALYEAADIDGASVWMSYSRIALPLSRPSIAATATFLFVINWNDLLYPLLFITSEGKQTLPLALLNFQGEFHTNYPLLFTGVILASVPMVVAYVFLQRYFVAGITAGAVKG